MPAPTSLPPHLWHQQPPRQTREAASPPTRQLSNGRGQQTEAGPSGTSWDGAASSATRNPAGTSDPGGYVQPSGPPPHQPAFNMPHGQGGYHPGPQGPGPGYGSGPPPLDFQLSQLQNQVYEEFHLRLYPLLRQHGDLIRDLDGRLYAAETRAAAGLERIKELEIEVAQLQAKIAPIPPEPAPAPPAVSTQTSTSALKRKKTIPPAAGTGKRKGAAGKASSVRDGLPPAVWEEVQVKAATQHLYGMPRPYPYWPDLAAGEEWPRLPSGDGVSEGEKAIRFDFDQTVSGSRNHTAFRAIVRYIVDNKRLHPAGLNMGPGCLVQAKGVIREAAQEHFEELKDSW